MAQPPTRTPSMPHTPLTSKPPPQPEPSGVGPTEQVNIHGIPPKPNMAPTEDVHPEAVTDATRAEMEGGKKALAQYAKRGQAEFDAGKKAVSRHGGKADVTHESKDEE